MEEKNVIAQEKGMPTLVVWVDRAALAPRNAPVITRKLIDKCLGARPRTKERTQDALMTFIERDQADTVLVRSHSPLLRDVPGRKKLTSSNRVH